MCMMKDGLKCCFKTRLAFTLIENVGLCSVFVLYVYIVVVVK